MRSLVLICLLAVPAIAQPKLALPDETAGLDGIVRALISAFDQVDVVALGEAHGAFAVDSDLRIALVRHPDFARKVRSIVVEFGSTTEQATLDRYIRGENVTRAQLEQVWKPRRKPASAASGTHRFTQTFWPLFARSIRSCLPMRGFASWAATRDPETTVAVRRQLSRFSRSRCFRSRGRRW